MMRLIAVLLIALSLGGCASGPPPAADRLDADDAILMAETAQSALENGKLGESANWVGSQSGHRGTVTPIRTIEQAGETPCRDYQLTATVGDDTAIGYDTACRRADGVWVSRYFADLLDVLRYGGPQRWRRDPFHNDPWCRWPHRYGYDPWCRARDGLSIGVGTSF